MPNLVRAISGPALALSLLAAPAAAGEWEHGLDIAAELRIFPLDPLNAGQVEHFQPSFTIAPDFRWTSADGRGQFVFVPLLRVDGADDERTHADIREGFVRFSDGRFTVTAGAARVFWGRTESRHLVDIINQSDTVEDIDEEDKLGQPMINVTLLNDWGSIDLYVMSFFRDRTFSGNEGRPIIGGGVDTDAPIFTRDQGREAIDVAARYAHYIGDWDFGVSVFHGTSREPRFAPGTDCLRPVYDLITQASVDFQYTRAAWLWKFEGLVREGHGDTFGAAVAGVEYTLYQVAGSGADLGLLAEYQVDGRDDGFAVESFGPVSAAPFTVAQNDVFVGARLAFNDVQDASLLGGTTVDLDDGTAGVFLEASRRFGENWIAEVEGRIFVTADPDNFANSLRDDDFFTFRLTRYF